MRLRAGAAAGSGADATRRRRRVVCYGWVVSASASEECRRLQASGIPVVVVFLPSTSTWLTLLLVYVAGQNNQRIPTKETKMAQKLWKYEEQHLESGMALQMLRVNRPKELVALKDYCFDMPVLSYFHVPGSLPQPQKDGTMLVETKALLAEPAQEVSRAALVFLGDLFNCGYCLIHIEDTTLMVDTSTTSVLLSAESPCELEVKLIESLEDVDNSIALMGEKLEVYLFTQNGLTTEEVPEVACLFSLMSQSGNTMWYAILNSAALVPLENRRELFIRMYEQLHAVIRKACLADYNDILEELDFPIDWHDSVCWKLNCIVLILYGGGKYNALATTKKTQAEQITRLFRNTGAHVLDRQGSLISRSDVALIHYALAPLLNISLQKALQKRGWLVSTNIHTLFAYTRRRR